MEEKEIRTIFKDFVKFLKERHIFGEFMSECVAFGKHSYPLQVMYKDVNEMKWQDFVEMIDFAFPWVSSKKKHDFYMMLGHKWKEKLYHKYN